MQGAPALTEIYSEKTRSFSNNQFTFMDIVSTLVFLVLSVVAVYFGWKLGTQYGPYFWAIVQAIGYAIRSYIIQLIVYAQEYARRSR